MYLKQLELLGFKSFASKTGIRFSSGVTAIVGPNGCGKTNILDALRWVLGEQKVTLLRGSKMEEVIFNGTADEKPLGMAEVTLTLVNNRGVLPTEYTELQITRRLFRSGESEYLLNKVPCRLKDITELFYDTGVGAHSYSVIQPEMVEAVISDKAEERRFLFEEAAGITKYKQRKKAAMRKLEATEQDLLRLNDIYGEVQTRVRSLRRQYKKAERYRKLAAEVEGWDLYLSSMRLKALQTRRRELRAELDSASDQLTRKRAELDTISATLEAERKEQIDLEHSLSEAAGRIHEITERAHSHETEISVLTEKRANARTLIERNTNDMGSLQKRAAVLTEQISRADSDLGTHRNELEELSVSLKEAESTQAETDTALLEARSLREQENRKLIELEGKLLTGKTAEDGLAQQKQELQSGLDTTNTEIESIRKAARDANEELDHRQNIADELQRSKGEEEEKQTALSRELESLVEKSEEQSHQISDLTASIEACQARRNLLEDMILHFEGHEAGVREVMHIHQRWPGIVSTVAEAFVPEEGSDRAVEAALGDLARFVICQDRKTAQEAIAYLKSEGKGRIGFLVPDSGTLTPGIKRPEIAAPGFRGWLDDHVTTSESLQPLMRAVLSQVAMFDEHTDPGEILAHLPYGFKAVSTDGTVYGRNVISGGSEDSFPLFRRKERVAEQEALLAELDERLSGVKRRRAETIARIAEIRAESDRRAGRIEELIEQLTAARNGLSEVDYRRRTLYSDLERLEKESRSLSEKLEKIRQRQYSLDLDCSQLSDRKQSLLTAVAVATEQLESLEKAAGVAVNVVSRLQMTVVEVRSRIEQTQSEITHLRELQQEISRTIESKESEIESARQEIESAGNNIARMEDDLKEAFQARREAAEQQDRLRTVQAEVMERVTAEEGRLKSVRAEKEALGESAHQAEMRLATVDSEIGTIGDRLKEEYGLQVSSLAINKPDDSVPDEDARELLQQKKEALKQFGAVNLLALEEYEESAEREKFLREQLTDLTSAKSDLQVTITKINQTARRLFNETFEKVRHNFRNLFVELFTGGEADIRLEDPSDPLETNIEIVARPRGKRLLSITMMSGGERALTAISLLFSLYLVKPSPFCILDEIDAPLDDANCHRFLKIIRSFSERTQFVIITHNKITMESADNLYGVTMERPGVSQLVAVRFLGNEDEVVAVDTASAWADVLPAPQTSVDATGEPDSHS